MKRVIKVNIDSRINSSINDDSSDINIQGILCDKCIWRDNCPVRDGRIKFPKIDCPDYEYDVRV